MQVKDVAFYPNNNGSSCMVSVEKGIIILTWYILKTSLSCNVENGIKRARDHCSILCEKRWWPGLGRWQEMAVQKVRPGE